MKKSKLLILIPLVALTMSGCDFSFLSSSSDTSSSTESRVDEGSTSYESYTLLYGFYYQGDLESIPEDTSLYLYGDLVGDTFIPLEANSNGYYGTTLKDIEYGTYSYSLYIDYNTNEISLESPLVYSGEETVSSASSSGGNLFITLTSSFNELLGEATTPGDTPEETTYTIEVDNASALSNLTYDSNAASQTSVDLQVYLVTTPSVGNPERIAASETDVELSNYDTNVISVSDLTVTPVGKGNTSITISKDGYQSTSVEVYVSDITVTGENNQITLYFTFMYESSKQTIPEDAKVYICGGWDGDDWSTDNVPTLNYDSTNECYYAVITYEEDVMNNHWYNYNLYLAGISESFSWDLTKLSSDNLWWAASEYTDPTYTKSEEITLSDTFENLLSGSTGGDEGGNTGSGTTDGGKPDATYIHNFTLVVTIYDSTGTTVKKAPSGYDLYIYGDMDGTWNTNWDGYYDWGDLVKLTETTDEFGNLAYTYTFGYVEVGSSPTYNICYAQTGTEVSWENALTSDKFGFTVDSGASDNYKQYVTCNIDSNLDNFMVDAVDTGTSGDQGTGGDAGDTGSGSLNDDGTATVTLNITMYAPDGTTSLKVPDGCKVYIVGDFAISTDDTYTWWTLDDSSVITLASSSDGTYLYTNSANVTPGSNYQFQLLLVEDNAEYDWYTYTIYSSTFDVLSNTYNGDSIDLKCTTTYTDLSDALNTGEDTGDTGDGTLTNDKATINLRITITDPAGNSLAIPSGYTVYIAGDFDLWESSSTWNVDSTHALTLYSSEDGEYVYTYSASVTPGTTYNYSLLFVEDGSSTDWWTYVISSSTFSVPSTYTNGGVLEFKAATEYYDLNDVITSGGSGDEDPSQGGDTGDAGTTNSSTLSVSFTDASTGTKTLEIPEGYSVYLAGSFDVTDETWNEDTSRYLTRDETQTDKYVYTYDFSSLSEGTYTVAFLLCETGTIDWLHNLGEQSFTVASDGTISPSPMTVQTAYDDLSDAFKTSGDVDFYIVFVDSTGTAVSSVPNCTWSISSNAWFNGSKTCDAVVSTTGSSKTCVYNSVIATAPGNDSDWISIYYGNWAREIDFPSAPTITTGTSTGYAVLVCSAELSVLAGTTSYTKGTCWDVTWYDNVTMDIISFIATL